MGMGRHPPRMPRTRCNWLPLCGSSLQNTSIWKKRCNVDCRPSASSLLVSRGIGWYRNRRGFVVWLALAFVFIIASLASSPNTSNTFLASVGSDDNAISDLQVDSSVVSDEALFACGMDRQLCPTLIARPCMHRCSTHEDSITAVHKCMEIVRQTVTRLPCANSRVLLLYDLGGAGYKNLDMVFAHELVKALNEAFPDRLEKVLVFNGHWSLRAAWSMVSALLHPETRRKVVFCDFDSLLDYVDHDHPYLQHLLTEARNA